MYYYSSISEESNAQNLKVEEMSQLAERSIEIHAVWRGENELMAHVYAWGINIDGTGHHYTGPFRIVMGIYENHESRQHCIQSLWRWFYRYPNVERWELAEEAEMVLGEMIISYE